MNSKRETSRILKYRDFENIRERKLFNFINLCFTVFLQTDLQLSSLLIFFCTGRRADDVQHKPDEYMEFYIQNSFQQIVTEAQRYLTSRFACYLEEPMSWMTKIFDFVKWPTTFIGSLEQKRWGLDEVEKLSCYMFEFKYITEEEQSSAAIQWPLFLQKVKQLSQTKYTSMADVFAKVVREGDPSCADMLTMLRYMMTFSVSTAECERGFSLMNRLKRVERTNMSQKSLDMSMRVKKHGLQQWQNLTQRPMSNLGSDSHPKGGGGLRQFKRD